MDDDKGSESLPKTPDRRIYIPIVLAAFFSIAFYIHSTPSPAIDASSLGIVLIVMALFAFVFESQYMAWVGVLPSALLLYAITETEWRNVPLLFKIYIIGGFFLAAFSLCPLLWKVAGPSKTTIFGNSHILYKTAYLLYSLKTVFSFYFSYFMLKSFTHPFFFIHS